MILSFNIELVPARLTPFDWSNLSSGNETINYGAVPLDNSNITGFQQPIVDNNLTEVQSSDIYATMAASGFYPNVNTAGQFVSDGTGVGTTGLSLSGQSIYPSSHPLFPLTQTGGLVFPYNPVITEGMGVKYDVTELTHTNENIHAFRNSDNVRLTLADCVWTAETFDRAIYTLGVIHFFRSYRLMDFGRGDQSQSGKAGSGRPPSPMWFSAYGDYMYNQVPVLLERVDFTFPPDIDYVGVPNPGTDAYNNQQLEYATSQSSTFGLGSQANGFTWIPMKFTIGAIVMVVQHSISYWTRRFSLDDFKSGLLVGRN
jgi:hypothetical protein